MNEVDLLTKANDLANDLVVFERAGGVEGEDLQAEYLLHQTNLERLIDLLTKMAVKKL